MTGWTRREAGIAVAGSLAGTLIGAPGSTATRATGRAACSADLAAMLDMIARDILVHAPETATYNGLDDALDGGPLARRMDDYSPDGELRRREALRRAQIRLDTLTLACAGEPRDAHHIAVARILLATGTASADIGYGHLNPFSFVGHVPYLVSQISGPHIDTPNVMEGQQSLNSAEAIDAWLEKLEGFARGYRGVEAKLAADEGTGCRPPKVLLAGALPAIDAFLSDPAPDHPLIRALRERVGAMVGNQTGSLERAEAALDRIAKPAFARLRNRVVAMVARGRDEAGIWAQPDGDALYAANVRTLGDTSDHPAAIHRLGQEEVGRITAEMDGLLKRAGYVSGSVAARMEALAREPRFRFPDTEAGRDDLLDHVRGLIAAMEANYPRILPPHLIPSQTVGVRRVPTGIEAGAPGGYYDGPSLDGSRSGSYWINLRDMAAVARFRLPTLSYHEGVPGHHTQASVAMARGDTPLLIRLASFNAYQEGWALYAEQLAEELGAYDHDPFGNLGRLQDELFRAVRLVVDTGLHHHRWTRERAIAFIQATTGIARSRVIAEVHRYMAWPAQALGYKLGQMRLLAMRRDMRIRDGPRYDIRRFHEIVLTSGPAPLSIVADRLKL